MLPAGHVGIVGPLVEDARGATGDGSERACGGASAHAELLRWPDIDGSHREAVPASGALIGIKWLAVVRSLRPVAAAKRCCTPLDPDQERHDCVGIRSSLIGER